MSMQLRRIGSFENILSEDVRATLSEVESGGKSDTNSGNEYHGDESSQAS